MKLMKFSNCRFTVAGDVYEFFLSSRGMPYENFSNEFSNEISNEIPTEIHSSLIEKKIVSYSDLGSCSLLFQSLEVTENY